RLLACRAPSPNTGAPHTEHGTLRAGMPRGRGCFGQPHIDLPAALARCDRSLPHGSPHTQHGTCGFGALGESPRCSGQNAREAVPRSPPATGSPPVAHEHHLFTPPPDRQAAGATELHPRFFASNNVRGSIRPPQMRHTIRAGFDAATFLSSPSISDGV